MRKIRKAPENGPRLRFTVNHLQKSSKDTRISDVIQSNGYVKILVGRWEERQNIKKKYPIIFTDLTSENKQIRIDALTRSFLGTFLTSLSLKILIIIIFNAKFNIRSQLRAF